MVARPRSSGPALDASSAPPWPWLASPLDALPAALNHLLDAEPWARAQLAPHVGKTLHVVVSPFTIRLAVDADGRVERSVSDDAPATTVTLPYGALVRAMSGGAAPLADLKVEGDADFAHTVSTLAKHLRWDAEEDLSRIVGDIAARRAVDGASRLAATLRRGRERWTAGVAEYLLDENPQLVRPRSVDALAAGVRTLRDDLARLEKRIDRLTAPGTGPRA